MKLESVSSCCRVGGDGRRRVCHLFARFASRESRRYRPLNLTLDDGEERCLDDALWDWGMKRVLPSDLLQGGRDTEGEKKQSYYLNKGRV